MIFYWQVGLSSEIWGPAQQCFEDVQVPSTLRDLRDLLKGAKFWLSFGNQCCLWWFVFAVFNGGIVKIRLFTTQLRAITPRHLVTSWCWCRSTLWRACCSPSPLSSGLPIHLPRRNRPEIQAMKLVISKSYLTSLSEILNLTWYMKSRPWNLQAPYQVQVPASSLWVWAFKETAQAHADSDINSNSP